MKAIILAAGQGTRMGAETKNKPKCMISYKGKPLIDYTIETFNKCGITDVIIINGFKNDLLEGYLADKNIDFITNKDFASTNMVYTLFCADAEMNDDLLISYSDIIYNEEVLMQLMKNPNDFVVTVDLNWRKLWSLRMNNPLKDAETMKIDDEGNIIELGNIPLCYEEIEGQYIGLIKVSNLVVDEIRNYYHKLDKSKYYDGNDFNNMYMTSFIQLLINSGYTVKADIIKGGWLEFDSQKDLTAYESCTDLL